MRLELFLFALALILAFLTGNITYFIKADESVDLKDLKQIRELHQELQEEVTPYRRLDLNIDYPTAEHLKLLNTQTNIGNNKQITLNSSECLKSKISQISSDFINKETLWLAYLCNQVQRLPLNFFKTPPFLHSNGMSYAFMQFKMLSTKKEKYNWLEKYANSMHINELKELQWPTSQNLRFLMFQSANSIQNIIKGENTFLSKDFYFIKTGNLKYYIIQKKIAERFFSRTRFAFSQKIQGCNLKIGNVCWEKRTRNLQSFLSQSINFLFIGTIIILILTASSLYSRLKRKRKEEDRKKHALRVLTHELRTPIASLILQINQLNQNTQALPLDVQESLLKLEGQIYRLKHLAEKSQSYLQTDTSDLIELKPSKILSLKDYLEDILSEYHDTDIQLDVQADTSLSADQYWLKMCITNLIDNAIKYGKTPIKIRLDQNKKYIFISIIDRGEIAYNNLKDLLKTKHTNTKGLGIGLTIVEKTLKEMHASLKLTTNPTQFMIRIPKDKNND
ncbi:MAG: DUF3404 domain-containing protein [Bacteriovoracaceae bacterium]|jgi:anti-sigma regulatory factor (Ser/Thr protein kinase)/large-conductance mechanosensitive channel|nr:hypothetical protein [Halobacteriovoraceae bacterium]MDP7320021.1 DUF3404 domain-containing protein [Bacteriovoracaceae bacterium]|tara:strand:- start:1634 stop:3154 length:1521 start_codon:yes stop_codon:yes gene_type:complete